MPKAVGDVFGVLARRNEVRSMRMPKIMEPDHGQTYSCGKSWERPGQHIWMQGRSIDARKDEILAAPARPEHEAMLALDRLVLAQHANRRRIEVDSTTGPSGLHRADLQLASNHCYLPTDREVSSIEVDITPPQAAQLAPAHPSRPCKNEQLVQRMCTNSVTTKESAELARSPRARLGCLRR